MGFLWGVLTRIHSTIYEYTLRIDDGVMKGLYLWCLVITVAVKGFLHIGKDILNPSAS
jgi:hypothetical protein